MGDCAATRATIESVRVCLVESLRRNDRLRGRVEVRLTSDATGNIVKVADGSSSLRDAKAASCVGDALRSLERGGRATCLGEFDQPGADLAYTVVLATDPPPQLDRRTLWFVSDLLLGRPGPMPDVARWRDAIENYASSVHPGTPLLPLGQPSRVDFARYLNAIHNRIHPLFERFLILLGSSAPTDPRNEPKLVTHLELVVGAADGALVRFGVTKTSGVSAFDAGALQAVHDAAPFGVAPENIRSADGNIYVHWEFYRHPQYACSTYFAHPYVLK
jgi:hypothetical protein